MAILIGVVALAVLPNIGRSRESKDLQTLDNILASANVAIANKKVTKDGSFTIDSTGSYTAGTDGSDVMKAVRDELGKVTLGSLDGATITVNWKVAGGASAALVTVKAADSSGNDVCQYTDSSDPDTDITSNGKRKYCVKSKASS